MAKRCPSGKVGHSSPRIAEVAAHAFARQLNRGGELARSIYAYRCEQCRKWHTTRQAGGPGVVQVFWAPPEALQRWAMGEDLL